MSEFESQGLRIIGFPTGQFNNEEPGDEAEILQCLANVRPGGGFKPAFPLMSKTLCNGNSEHILWTWLKSLCPLYTSFPYGSISWTPISSFDIRWNFEKFLIDSTGRPCRRYDYETPADTLREDIMAALKGGCPRAERCSSTAEAMTSGARRL